MNALDYFRNLLVSLITGVCAYLQPINGEVYSLFWVFVLNFVFGLVTDILANNQSFNFKKAFRCIGEATIFFVLVCSIYVIGDHHGDKAAALQCVSFITYSVFYFYAVNVLRNLCILLPKSSVGYKVMRFFFYVLSVEFVKHVPFLTDYFRKDESNGNSDRASQVPEPPMEGEP